MTASKSHDTATGVPSAARAFAVAGGLIAAVVLLDQGTKWLVVEYLSGQPRVVEITGFFNLVLTHNTGISFGLFRGSDEWVRWALILAAFGIMAILLAWLRREPGTILTLAVGLICGGALGNVADRLRIGAVVDFMDFHVGTWHWPAFNLADSAIAIGVACLVLDGLFRAPSSSKN